MKSSTVQPDQDSLYQEAVNFHGPTLQRLTRGYEAEPEKRRDLLQEIHLQLGRSFAQFDDRCSTRTWLYHVAHNCARSHVMRERRVYSQLGDLGQLDEVIGQAGSVTCLAFSRNELQRQLNYGRNFSGGFAALSC